MTIQNIDEMRRREGIDDVELHEEIQKLSVGDVVRLTFLTSDEALTGDTLPVRITSINGSAFRGKLAAKPGAASDCKLAVTAAVFFTAAHIHSIRKVQPIGRR